MRDRVFLSIAGVSSDWIVGTIAKDIKRVLEQEGIACDFGPPEKYKNQEICYHLGYAYAKPFKSAKINSVFITHIDDKIKEQSVASMRDSFDSFICMSTEDESFLTALGIPKEKVFGITLPVRNNYIRPLSLGIFSSHYKDGRKNEEWLTRFCRENESSQLVNFIFIGPNWGAYLQTIAKLNCSFEWHNVSRTMPYEYEFQQSKLPSLDYYFYLGMDGGAMGTYDAYAYGVKLMITDDGYHRELPFIEHGFESYKGFETSLKNVIQAHENRLTFFKSHSVDKYAMTLFKIWTNSFVGNDIPDNKKVLIKRRGNYFPLTVRRVLGYIKRKMY